MAVRLFLASGGERVIDEADAVRVDEPFVLVTRWYPGIRQVQTVLTLLATDVTAAEVTANGIRTEYIVVNGAASGSARIKQLEGESQDGAL